MEYALITGATSGIGYALAECFAKNRDKTLGYFENNCTNDFIVNKAISKCRDSFRVSKEDKDYLLNFKRK